MINYTILYCTVLYYTILYHAMLHYAVLHYAIVCYAILYYTKSVYFFHFFNFLTIFFHIICDSYSISLWFSARQNKNQKTKIYNTV